MAVREGRKRKPESNDGERLSERPHINLHRPALHFRSMKPTLAARLGQLALVGLSLGGALGVPRGTAAGQVAAPAALKYPTTPRGNQADELSGVRVADPYRWLEN